MGGIFIYPCPIPCIKVTQMELYKQLANFFPGVRLKKCGQTQKHFSKLISLPSHRISGLEKLSAEKKRAALKVLNGEQYDTTGLI